jgi:hypothetical protein
MALPLQLSTTLIRQRSASPKRITLLHSQTDRRQFELDLLQDNMEKLVDRVAELRFSTTAHGTRLDRVDIDLAADISTAINVTIPILWID